MENKLTKFNKRKVYSEKNVWRRENISFKR